MTVNKWRGDQAVCCINLPGRLNIQMRFDIDDGSVFDGYVKTLSSIGQVCVSYDKVEHLSPENNFVFN
jgi:hypothetical protein